MPFFASREALRACIGGAVGDGHCVALVQQIAGAPRTASWRRGRAARDAQLPHGIAIATFDDAGRYANDTEGESHACILIAQLPEGLHVIDQWQGRVAGLRVIRFKAGAGPAANDADRYHVIESA